jgi:hypothetical protein
MGDQEAIIDRHSIPFGLHHLHFNRAHGVPLLLLRILHFQCVRAVVLRQGKAVEDVSEKPHEVTEDEEQLVIVLLHHHEVVPGQQTATCLSLVSLSICTTFTVCFCFMCRRRSSFQFPSLRHDAKQSIGFFSQYAGPVTELNQGSTVSTKHWKTWRFVTLIYTIVSKYPLKAITSIYIPKQVLSPRCSTLSGYFAEESHTESCLAIRSTKSSLNLKP